jgi:hypothetical protein
MKNLPATVDEAQAVDVISHWIDRVAAALTAGTARHVLRNHIRDRLRQGTIPTMQVIAAARAGHEDADLALRQLAAEMLDRGEMPPTALRAYVQEALVLAPVSYPPGRNIADTWLRDIGIAVLVALAAERWRLPTSRNRASARPSACFLVSIALGRRGFNLGERQVERIVREHSRLAQKLSASMPPI